MAQRDGADETGENDIFASQRAGHGQTTYAVCQTRSLPEAGRSGVWSLRFRRETEIVLMNGMIVAAQMGDPCLVRRRNQFPCARSALTGETSDGNGLPAKVLQCARDTVGFRKR
jgi:hypothetical protein